MACRRGSALPRKFSPVEARTGQLASQPERSRDIVQPGSNRVSHLWQCSNRFRGLRLLARHRRLRIQSHNPPIDIISVSPILELIKKGAAHPPHRPS